MLTQEQLKMRQTGLGGSDISAALGHSPWKTQLQLWAEKTGEVESLAASPAMEWGNRLEAPIYSKFVDNNPHLMVSHGAGTIRHPDYSFLLATPDGFIVDGEDMGILEVKTSGQSIWDEVPLYYLLQVQHYMYVMNRRFAYFAVLFRGVEYREYGPFLMNRGEYEKTVLPKLQEFWSAVESNTPVFAPADMSDLSFFSPLEEEVEPIVTDDHMAELVIRIREMQQIGSMNTEEMKAAKFDLAQAMGGSRKLLDDAGKTMAIQTQSHDSLIVDSKKLKAADPELFEKYSKTRKGYRSVRVY